MYRTLHSSIFAKDLWYTKNPPKMSPEIGKAIALIIKITIWLACLPLMIGIMRFRRANYGMKAILFLMLISLIADNVQLYYRDQEQFSLYTPRIFTFIEFIALTIFFIAFTSRRNLKTIMLVLIVPFTGIVVLDFIMEGLMKRDDLSVGIESLIFIAYSIATLYNMLKDAEYPRIMATPQFWILSGILFYFGGGIFVFITSNYVQTLSAEAYTLLWGTHALICMIYYSLLAVGLWKIKESQS